MGRTAEAPVLPPGSEQIAAWARQHRFAYEGWPDQRWFRGWEPYDTMVSPEAWFNSVSWALGPGSVTVAEPWLAPLDSEPLDRTLITFVTHPGFRRRAAARGGEHFNTRVTFLESAPPPRVELGDPVWDRAMATFAASASEADAALPLVARQLLASWGFSGHVEVRPGGLVVHFAGMQPVVGQIERLPAAVPSLVRALLGDR
jgi:hypothetical protein